MPNNYLLTGAPGSGKTTVVETVIEELEADGYSAGGMYCPEILESGQRVGFEIVNVATGESRILAHLEREAGPSVGKYRVNVENVDTVSKAAIPGALSRADFLVIDEIAPMEVASDEFVRHVRTALDSEMPLLAVVHSRSTTGFIGEVKEREDVERFEVTAQTRGNFRRPW